MVQLGFTFIDASYKVVGDEVIPRYMVVLPHGWTVETDRTWFQVSDNMGQRRITAAVWGDLTLHTRYRVDEPGIIMDQVSGREFTRLRSREKAEAWLDQRYSEWRDPMAYWG